MLPTSNFLPIPTPPVITTPATVVLLASTVLPTYNFLPIAVPPTTCNAAAALEAVASVPDSILVSLPTNNLPTIPVPPSTVNAPPLAELLASVVSLKITTPSISKVP